MLKLQINQLIITGIIATSAFFNCNGVDKLPTPKPTIYLEPCFIPGFIKQLDDEFLHDKCILLKEAKDRSPEALFDPLRSSLNSRKLMYIKPRA